MSSVVVTSAVAAAAQRTPVNRRLDPNLFSIQMARAPQINRINPRRNSSSNNNNSNNNNGEHGSYMFTMRTPNGPPMRLRVNLNLIPVDQVPRPPRVQIRDADGDDADTSAARTRSSARIRSKKSACNHALDRKFCSKCHIRRRHLNRWWLRQQYRQH